MEVQYCPDGRSMETGLCYARCPHGWTGIGCSCWQGARSRWRGCGVRAHKCDARSFRREWLPPPGADALAPFTLLLSADPQLFRTYKSAGDAPAANRNNRQLVSAMNAVTSLGSWPADAGGGLVQEPRSMVVLGDLTEHYKEQQQDSFRHFYDPSYPGGTPTERVRFATWLMLGNHDYVNNVHYCSEKAVDRNFCAKWAVSMMRAALSPDCPSGHWTGLPKSNITSLDVASMSYSFDYGRYHFVVLQYNPRYTEPVTGVTDSMQWLATELAHATAQQRRIVLLMHAHKELQLQYDPTFSKMISSSNVVAIFYGHIHIRPWGFVGNFPNTSVPLYNCGASWYNVYCLAEFAEDGLRVGVAAHNGSGNPFWFGSSLHSLQRRQRAKPVLEVFVPNPNVTTWSTPVTQNDPGDPAAAAMAEAVAKAAEASQNGTAASGGGGADAGSGGGGGGGGGGGTLGGLLGGWLSGQKDGARRLLLLGGR